MLAKQKHLFLEKLKTPGKMTPHHNRGRYIRKDAR